MIALSIAVFYLAPMPTEPPRPYFVCANLSVSGMEFDDKAKRWVVRKAIIDAPGCTPALYFPSGRYFFQGLIQEPLKSR